MLHRLFAKRATIVLVASVTLGTACNEHGPSAPRGPSASPVELAPALSSIVTTTVWDFVALAGSNGDVGNPKTFTIAGAGSVTATSTPTVAFPSSVTTKGLGDPFPSDERGLGVCQKGGVGGACLGDEVGTDLGDGEKGSLILDFTGLAAGSTVTNVMLSSVQFGECYSVSTSADGSTYALLQTGLGASNSSAVILIGGVPATTKFLRFDPCPGDFGDDYVVESVTTVGETSTGKTFSIGPSSMEGAILITNGDWVNGGYSFKFVNGSHIATNFTVSASVSITGPCIGGGPASDTFTFPLNTATYGVPANNTDWLPTGDQNSVLSWEGSVIASGVCGGIGKLDARHGAVFTATVSQNPPTGSLVNFRFKYRDPKAKGKLNTNCLDTSDPNRAKADVCGASWSQTVRDP